MIGKRANELPDAVTALGHERGLAVEQVALGNLLGNQPIEVGQLRAGEQADHGHDEHDQQHHAHIRGVLAAVEAPERFAQRIDAVREREHRVYRAEEGIGHLDRVQARAAGNLNEHHDDAQPDTDMLQARRQGIGDAQIRKGQKNRRDVERGYRGGLDADEQAAGHADDGLQRHQYGEEHPAADVALHDGKARDALFVDLELEDDAQHQRSHP